MKSLLKSAYTILWMVSNSRDVVLLYPKNPKIENHTKQAWQGLLQNIYSTGNYLSIIWILSTQTLKMSPTIYIKQQHLQQFPNIDTLIHPCVKCTLHYKAWVGWSNCLRLLPGPVRLEWAAHRSLQPPSWANLRRNAPNEEGSWTGYVWLKLQTSNKHDEGQSIKMQFSIFQH